MSTNDDTSVSAVAINSRVPRFWRNRPTLWFIQLEAVLAPSKPTDDAKYQYVIANLDQQELEQVADLVTNPPATDKYDSLKSRLIACYEESSEQRVQRLFTNLELGDSTPSQLLRRMRDLSGTSGTPDKVLEVLWLGKLPAHVRAILTTSTGSLDNLAATADKILLHCQPSAPPVATVETSHSNSEILKQLAAVTKRLNELDASLNNRGRSRSRSRTRFNSYRTSRSNSRQRDTTHCYYHKRFGAEAKKCSQPCSFVSVNANQQHQ